MKRCEFLDLNRSAGEDPKSYFRKEEDASLPSFTTDMPAVSASSEKNGFIETAYAWNPLYSDSPFLRVRHTVLRKGENIEPIIRLRVRDGTDTIVVRVDSMLYLLRKTSIDVARAVLLVAYRIRDHVEDIIGYLQTLAGSIYSISKLASGSWVFDPHLAQHRPMFQTVDMAGLGSDQKQRLFEMVMEKLLALHRQDLILKSFTLHNVVLTLRQLLLIDLRELRTVRKRSVLVEHFCGVLRYLVAAGVATRSDVFQSLVHYTVAMEPACGEWYAERTGKTVRDNLAMVAEMEQALYA